MSSKTLRDQQVAALTSLLQLNAPPSTNPASNGTGAGSSAVASAALPTWKVLIMDKVAQDVMATSLRVQDLRDQGVTLHMSVSSPPLTALSHFISSTVSSPAFYHQLPQWLSAHGLWAGLMGLACPAVPRSA